MAKQGAEVLVAKERELAELEETIKNREPERDKVNRDFEEKDKAFREKDDELRKIQEEQREKRKAEEAAKASQEENMVIEGDGNVELNEMVHGGVETKEEDAKEGDPAAKIPKPPRPFARHTHLDDEKKEDNDEDEFAPEKNPEWIALKDAKEEARKVMNSVINELRELEEKKVEAERILNMQVGEDMCLVQLGTDCYELHDKYTYKICPMKQAKQDGTDLGRFKSFEGDESIPLAKRQMKFDEGSHCWDGPKRNTLVTVRCGPEPKVVSASEPSRCTYTVTMETPCACSKEDLDEAVANINAMLADEAED